MASVFSPTKSNILACARLLAAGKLVVFPTETVYGLGANALDETAVRKIFASKGRPKKNPLIVHVSSWKMVSQIAGRPISRKEKSFLGHFWPGPLTVVLEKSDLVPAAVTAGLPTVAIRWPSNPIALKLISAANVPIAAPSANPSSKPSATLSSHVRNLPGVEAVLDGGPTVFGIESTVLDLGRGIILRPGPIGLLELEPFFPGIAFHESLVSGKKVKNPASPGMKYRHYSPKCKIVLLAGSEKKISAFLLKQKKSDGIICSEKLAKKFYGRSLVFSFSSPKDLAHNLFAFFHELDRLKVSRAFVQGVAEQGIGFSVMNRLKKAAAKSVSLS